MFSNSTAINDAIEKEASKFIGATGGASNASTAVVENEAKKNLAKLLNDRGIQSTGNKEDDQVKLLSSYTGKTEKEIREQYGISGTKKFIYGSDIDTKKIAKEIATYSVNDSLIKKAEESFTTAMKAFPKTEDFKKFTAALSTNGEDLTEDQITNFEGKDDISGYLKTAAKQTGLSNKKFAATFGFDSLKDMAD
ncbi:MAG: hypothetical protein MR911_10540 [Spirochaetia bacterium]|nr:hypothetical protein [Spirochaetia bacterium]